MDLIPPLLCLLPSVNCRQFHQFGAMCFQPFWNAAPVTIKTAFMRKATGSHLIKSISVEKIRGLSLASAMLKIEYATKVILYNLSECFLKELTCPGKLRPRHLLEKLISLGIFVSPVTPK